MEQETQASAIEGLFTEPDPSRLRDLARSLHPADLASAMQQMDRDRRLLVFACLDDSAAAEVLGELDAGTQQSILAALPLARASDLVEEMSADDAADLLGELTEDHAQAILGAMETEDARDVRELLDYESDTAGGQMITEFIAVSESLSVEETIQQLRNLAPEAETVYYLYVVGEHDCLVGVVSLRSLIVSDPSARVADVMNRDVISISVDADQEEAAELIARYNLVAVPVVDSQNRPIGIITVDDAVDVIDEETSADIFEMGGESADDHDDTTAWTLLQRRLPRLMGTLCVAMAAGWFLRRLVSPPSPGSLSGLPGLIPAGNETFPWTLAAFLPAMLTLSWLFESQARSSLVARLAGSFDRTEKSWGGLLLEAASSALLALGCALACTLALAAALPDRSAAYTAGAALALGLAISSLASYVVPRMWLTTRPDRDSLPAGVTIIAHGLGLLTYLAVAWIGSR